MLEMKKEEEEPEMTSRWSRQKGWKLGKSGAPLAYYRAVERCGWLFACPKVGLTGNASMVCLFWSEARRWWPSFRRGKTKKKRPVFGLVGARLTG
jgi:hypothetical protein